MVGGVLPGPGAEEVVTGLGGGEPGFCDGAFAAHKDQGSGEGEVGSQRFDVEGVEVSDFDAPVSGFPQGSIHGQSFPAQPR